MTLPAPPFPVARQRFFDENGKPLAGGRLYFYAAGTSTPEDVFQQSDLDPLSVWTQPVELDADGYVPGTLYPSPVGYKFTLKTSADVLIFEADNIGDTGWIFFGTFGQQQAAGSKDQTGSYTIENSDALVTFADTTTAVAQLPAAADRLGLPIVIKNLGSGTVEVTPNGSETIDGVAAAYVLPVFASPDAPTVTLVPTTGGWFIVSSHAL